MADKQPQRRRRRSRPILWTLALPTFIGAGAFAVVADNPIVAAGLGAIVGFCVGLGLLAFPNLDRGGPEDTDSMLH
jgi:hypothetical protein